MKFNVIITFLDARSFRNQIVAQNQALAEVTALWTQYSEDITIKLVGFAVTSLTLTAAQPQNVQQKQN